MLTAAVTRVMLTVSASGISALPVSLGIKPPGYNITLSSAASLTVSLGTAIGSVSNMTPILPSGGSMPSMSAAVYVMPRTAAAPNNVLV